MKLFGKGILLVLCSWLAVCFAFGAVQEETTPQQEQMKEIAQALSSVKPPSSEFDFVTFDLSRTTVILRGFTIGENRKEDCANAVKEISWVGHVLNYIEALPDTYNDQKLRDNIRFILRQRVPRLSGGDRGRLRIKVKEGNVTLIGSIDADDVEALDRAIGEMKVEELLRSVENKTVVRE